MRKREVNCAAEAEQNRLNREMSELNEQEIYFLFPSLMGKESI